MLAQYTVDFNGIIMTRVDDVRLIGAVIMIAILGKYGNTRGISIPLGERCAILPSEVSLRSSYVVNLMIV